MGRISFIVLAVFPFAFCSLAQAMYYDSSTGYYYETVDTPGTWNQQWVSASELTIDPGGTTLYGRLAVISNQNVENDVFNVLPEGASPNLAIGLSDPTDTGNFQWIDGTAITYGGPDTSREGEVTRGKQQGCRGWRTIAKCSKSLEAQGSTETGGYPHVGIPPGIPKNQKDRSIPGGIVLEKLSNGRENRLHVRPVSRASRWP